jgi:hypothetical protein
MARAALWVREWSASSALVRTASIDGPVREAGQPEREWEGGVRGCAVGAVRRRRRVVPSAPIAASLRRRCEATASPAPGTRSMWLRRAAHCVVVVVRLRSTPSPPDSTGGTGAARGSSRQGRGLLTVVDGGADSVADGAHVTEVIKGETVHPHDDEETTPEEKQERETLSTAPVEDREQSVP